MKLTRLMLVRLGPLALGAGLLAGCAQPATPATTPAATAAVAQNPPATPSASVPGSATPWQVATAAPTPTTSEPAVAVARLERLQAPVGSPVAFAPDGRTYLQVVGSGQTLLLYPLDGGPARRLPIVGLPAHPPGGVLAAAWTPDGAAIVVTDASGDGMKYSAYLVDPASGAARRLCETRWPSSLRFDAHGRLVVATQTAFVAVDLASGAAIELPGIAPAGIVPDEPAAETQLAFSSDGRYVAALQGQELAVVDLNTGQRTTTIDHIAPQWRAAFAWSADSRKLAYPTQRDGVPELWLVGPDGTGARRLLARDDASGRGGTFAGLAWLPGTPYVVYQLVPWRNNYGASEYGVISAEGGPAKTLFENGMGLNLSRDGRLIQFMRMSGKQPGAEEGGNWVAVLEYEGVAASTPAPTAAASPTP